MGPLTEMTCFARAVEPHRRHSVTKAGQAFYGRCRAVMREAEDEAAITEFGSAWLMPFIAAYLARNGEVSVKLAPLCLQGHECLLLEGGVPFPYATPGDRSNG